MRQFPTPVLGNRSLTAPCRKGVPAGLQTASFGNDGSYEFENKPERNEKSIGIELASDGVGVFLGKM